MKASELTTHAGAVVKERFTYHNVEYPRTCQHLTREEVACFPRNVAYDTVTTLWGARAYPFINKSIDGESVPPCPIRTKLALIYDELSRCVRSRAEHNPASILITLKSLGYQQSLDQSLWVAGLNVAQRDILGLATMYPELQVRYLSQQNIIRIVDAQLSWCVLGSPSFKTQPECSLGKLSELMSIGGVGATYFHTMCWPVSLFKKAFRALPCVRGDAYSDEIYTPWRMGYDRNPRAVPPHEQVTEHLHKLAQESPPVQLIKTMFSVCPASWKPSQSSLAYESIFSVFERLKPPPTEMNSIEFSICVEIFSFLKILGYDIHAHDFKLFKYDHRRHAFTDKYLTYFEKFVMHMHASPTADPGAISFVVKAMEHAGIPVIGTPEHPFVRDDVRAILDGLPGYRPKGQRARWARKTSDTTRPAAAESAELGASAAGAPTPAAASGAGGDTLHFDLSKT